MNKHKRSGGEVLADRYRRYHTLHKVAAMVIIPLAFYFLAHEELLGSIGTLAAEIALLVIYVGVVFHFYIPEEY